MEGFLDATPSDRVEATLAGLREPCSKAVVYKFAGVDLAAIDNETARRLASLLDQWEVRDELDQPTGRYWVPAEQKADVLARVGIDIRSVRSRIISLGREKYGQNKRR